jgi:hypothetical protein
MEDIEEVPYMIVQHSENKGQQCNNTNDAETADLIFSPTGTYNVSFILHTSSLSSQL